MDRIPELERLFSQQAELIEHMKHGPDDLDQHIRFTYLCEQIAEIEDRLSLTAVLFTRRC